MKRCHINIFIICVTLLFFIGIVFYSKLIFSHIHALPIKGNNTQYICVLYHGHDNLNFALFPVLFGVKDFIVELSSLCIFARKFWLLHQANKQIDRNATRDLGIIVLVRKLIILQIAAILSTSAFYTVK